MVNGVNRQPFRLALICRKSHGRPENLLLPEPPVSRLRPAWPGQPARLLPQRPQPATPRAGLPDLSETVLRTQGHAAVSGQTPRGQSPLGPAALAGELWRAADQPSGRGE